MSSITQQHECSSNQLGCLDMVSGEAMDPQCPMYKKQQSTSSSSSQMIYIDEIISEYENELYYLVNAETYYEDYIDHCMEMDEYLTKEKQYYEKCKKQ